MVNIVAGDYGFHLDFVVTDNDGDAINLTDSNVLFKMRVQGSTGDAYLIGSCDIDDAATGSCHYAVLQNDINDVGVYSWELEVLSTGKKITSLGTESIKVKTNIP